MGYKKAFPQIVTYILQSMFCLIVKLKVVLLKRAEAVYSAFLYLI